MSYQGSCHCGRIAFSVSGKVEGALSCNCSICRRKGALLWFVPREQLVLDTPAADMATYQFNQHLIKHHFCPVCGIHPFGEAHDPQGRAMAAVNLRCLEDVDLDSVPVQHYDGRAR
ncbi:aldehyde-activating protein [Bordetella genomosp. 1]|uniref:Aldehyde-activating protein n=1 Tax=Bordetella genomosp. 1 TaxID=1395607 RepID=A0A261SHV7_9BORD|nr:GFA family protein [Bordetella genomosp. 1]MDQ8034855.1 GFA family protein [Bordetella sp.]OZI35943.1 aldehyde-activating protein [Bordetella genomosp. 1]